MNGDNESNKILNCYVHQRERVRQMKYEINKEVKKLKELDIRVQCILQSCPNRKIPYTVTQNDTSIPVELVLKSKNKLQYLNKGILYSSLHGFFIEKLKGMYDDTMIKTIAEEACIRVWNARVVKTSNSIYFSTKRQVPRSKKNTTQGS